MLSIDPAKPDMYVHMSVRMNDTDTAARQFLHVHMLVLYEVNGVHGLVQDYACMKVLVRIRRAYSLGH